MDILMSSAHGAPCSETSHGGSDKGFPVSARTSRAMPTTLRQSGRLGVTSKSSTMSSKPAAIAKGVPGSKASSKTMMPSWLSPSPSSSSAQIIPSDSMPRIFALLIVKSPGSVQPGSATATFCPDATLGAPQTIVLTSPPTSTLHTERRSAFGCPSHSRTEPTTTPRGSPP